MYLDKQHPTPVYLQLKHLLQNQIEQGVYRSHQQLPSERHLCQYHSLSRMTVRKALQQLISDGFAYTRAGKGTFVSKKESTQPKQLPPHNLHTDEFYQQKLMPLLVSFNSVGIEQTISEALATHSLETIAGSTFLKTINNLEQQWQHGEISLLAQNYAIATLRSQLIGMMNSATMPETGPKVLLACAPEDLHEIGLLVLALTLRRKGFVVVYLGPNLSIDEFDWVVEMVKPELICLSAATEQAANHLINLGHSYSDKWAINGSYQPERQKHMPLFTFGGVVFTQNTQLVSDTPGYYLGSSIKDAVENIQMMLAS
jgi:DNA-binding transcriptional regulator YhcF (GntR family)